jgi:hypothetical protein
MNCQNQTRRKALPQRILRALADPPEPSIPNLLSTPRRRPLTRAFRHLTLFFGRLTRHQISINTLKLQTKQLKMTSHRSITLLPAKNGSAFVRQEELENPAAPAAHSGLSHRTGVLAVVGAAYRRRQPIPAQSAPRAESRQPEQRSFLPAEASNRQGLSRVDNALKSLNHTRFAPRINQALAKGQKLSACAKLQ